MSLTNEQIKQIIDGAPDKATHVNDDCYYEYGMIVDTYRLSDLAEILALREWVEALAKHCTNMTNQVSELMQETSRQAMLVNELQAAKIDAVRLLDAALCPCCDKSGAYYDNYGEVQQCQWCYEQSN
jgi:hypothetical protein